MPDNLIVRKADSRDVETLKQFYTTIYGSRTSAKFPTRWNWLFRDNPWAGSDAPHVYIAEKNGRILGHTAAMCVPCKAFEAKAVLGWSVDTIVLPESRGMGIGTKLQRINQDRHPLFASLAMSRVNMHIKIKLGAKQGPTAHLYIKLLRFSRRWKLPRQFAQRYNILLLPVFLGGYILSRLIQAAKMRRAANGSFVISEPKPAVFGEAETTLWRSVRSRYDFAVERDAEYLNWRYRDVPGVEHECIRAYDTDGQLVGLAVYRFAEEAVPPVGILLELFDQNADKAVLGALLRSAQCHLRQRGANQVQVASSDSTVQAVLAANGYLLLNQKPLIINSDEAVIERLSPESTGLLTKGDQDWDQYPQAAAQSPLDILWQGLKRRLSRFSKF